MTETFLSVCRQTGILFILILTGSVCSKRNFFSDSTIEDLTKFVLYLVTPCVIIESFHRPFDTSMLFNLGLAAAAAAAVHLINILLAHMILKNPDDPKQRVMRFSSIFSNCGYMALPMQYALLGNDGVFYGAVFIAIFNIIAWTYGLVLISGSRNQIKIKKIILNPGIAGITLGMIFFLTPLKLPEILLIPVKSLAVMNTPLPMMIIGYYLSRIKSPSLFKDRKMLLAVFSRLIFFPLAAFIILYLSGFRGALFISMIIAASAPSAANTAMFAAMYKKDAGFAVTIVSVSTFFAIVTMPLIITAAVWVGR